MSAYKRYDSTRQWYTIHTYAGYEEKVADSIKQRIDSVDMADKIFDVLVPKEKQIEIKNGKRKVVEKKIFQGYVLVEMKLTEDTWFIVRNTPGVTGFVGSGIDPTPVPERDIARIKKRMGVMTPSIISTLQRAKSSALSTGRSKDLTARSMKLMP